MKVPLTRKTLMENSNQTKKNKLFNLIFMSCFFLIGWSSMLLLALYEDKIKLKI